MAVSILGISAYGHDSAAALVRDGEIVAAAQEERFTRKKFDARFPRHAAGWCLAEAGLRLAEVDYIAVHGTSVRDSMLRSDLQALAAAGGDLRGRGSAPPPLLCCEHHRSHAASAFLPSPFRRAAVLCVDGLGESATTSLWLGEDNRLTTQWEIGPHPLGLLYSAFTHYCGFKVNSGEYKLMGLAPTASRGTSN
jgi:carbamoyltransferase